MSQQLRFGVWALVHGSRGAYGDPEEPYDASWERNRALVLEAEQLGYDLTLFAQHTVNPRDDALDELEPWTAAAALAALTQRNERAFRRFTGSTAYRTADDLASGAAAAQHRSPRR